MDFGFVAEPNADQNPLVKSFSKLEKALSASAVATEDHIIPEFTPLSDQGNEPSCTANVGVDIAEALIGLENPEKVIQLSRSAPWWLARLREGTHRSIVGVRLSSLFHVLSDVGVCSEEMWPYEVPDGVDAKDWYTRKPKLAALECMSDNKLAGFVQIFEVENALLDAIDCSILADHPVGYGVAIDEVFRRYRGEHDDAIMPPENPDAIIGRHAIAIFGRRVRKGRRNYYIRNSWGARYGLNGHVWVDQSYVTCPEASNHTVGTIAAKILL